MDSRLNRNRPPVFCPGCAHERVVHALDAAFGMLGLAGERIVIVSDIGCSGLFDMFFNTHAVHGTHGRALTYATGIKMARPDLHVVVTMGDGGLGIGGAHVLGACRRNMNLTLLVLNNFNFGMTGGQCSATTPADARVASGFLNRLEAPLDICAVAGAAGAGFVGRASAYQSDLAERIAGSIAFEGFSLLDIHGICPGRYTKSNHITPKSIETSLAVMTSVDHFAEKNRRKEYGRHYREVAAELLPMPDPVKVSATLHPLETGRREMVILGRAGQRIGTAGEVLCLAGAAAGLFATQKNDYPITVLRGHSVSEVVLSSERIGFTGVENPRVVIALAAEGVFRRKGLFDHLGPDTLVIHAKGISIPECGAPRLEVDFDALGVKPQYWAMASLGVLSGQRRVISVEMLKAAVNLRFEKRVADMANGLLQTIIETPLPVRDRGPKG